MMAVYWSNTASSSQQIKKSASLRLVMLSAE
jgi:hypothetical protein